MSENKSICSECDRPALRRGYCGRHYHRWLKYGDPLAGGRYLGLTKAFINELLQNPPDGCVMWPFATSRGYAYTAWNGKYVSVSRLVCRLAHGDPPNVGEPLDAAHRCGNGRRGCVSPSCLYWATKTENASDRHRHGTAVFGEQCCSSKLTDLDADAIRNDSRKGTVIAAEYGISPSQVSRIRSGKSRQFTREELVDMRIAYTARLKEAEQRMEETKA